MLSSVLEYRCVICLEGPDALSFLNRVSTIKVSFSNVLHYALILTPQGKIFCDFFLTYYEGRFFLDIPRRYEMDVVLFFKSYRVNFLFSIRKTDYRVVVSEAPITSLSYIDPRPGMIAYRNFDDAWGGYNQDFLYIYHRNRINSRVPEICHDFYSKDTYPFDCGLDCAIDMSKGCFIGQEVISRVLFRNKVRKRLYRACTKHEDDALPDYQDDIIYNGEVVGHMCSKMSGICLILCKKASFDVYADNTWIELSRKGFVEGFL